MSLFLEAAITLEPFMVDLVHVQDAYGVHASATVDAGNHWLPVNRVILHLLEDVLWDDGGREGVITNGHLVRRDLTETLRTIDISGRREREKYMYEHQYQHCRQALYMHRCHQRTVISVTEMCPYV